MNRSGSWRFGNESRTVKETMTAQALRDDCRDSGAPTEMGPTLRSTPLSPACGSRGTLDARRPDAGSDKLLRALKVGFGFARRSRRRRFRRGSGSIARIGLLPPGGSETVPVDLGLIAASALPEGAANSSAPSRQTRPFRLCALAASTVWDLVRTRTNLGAFRFSSLHRAASRRRVVTVPKSLLPRRPFGLCLGRANPRLDDWKVRRLADSGKRGTVQLSTFRLNASGQRWITQRFVAEWPDYARSRCPSSLRRRALSLMNPAASCWS